MAAKQKGVLYIQRSGINYYAADRSDILRLDFPQTTVQDMEVVNKDELLRLIQNFIASNKILPSRSIIILSDTIFFQKDITASKPEDLDTQTKLFLSNVPFEHVTFKIFDIEKVKRIIATNKDLYQYIKEYLEKNGFTISLVVAPLSLGKELISETMSLDQAKAVIQKMDTIKPTENFLEQPKQVTPTEGPYIQMQKKKTSKSTLPILLPVFGLLMAVFVGVFYMQSRQNNTIVANGAQVLSPFPTIAPITTPTLAQEPSPVVSTESAALQKKVTTIQILNGSQIAGQAEKGRKDLSALGYENIKTGNADSVATSKTLIVFVKKVPEFIRNDIITELKKTYQEISTQEIEDGEFNVIITLGNLITTTPTNSP